MEFVLSVLASILAAVILIVATGALSRTARSMFTAAISQWLGIDIEYVFSRKDDVQADLKKELEGASEVCILTSRGNELQRDPFSPLFLPRGPRKVDIRVLLPETAVPDGQYDWTDQRERELASFDPAFGGGLLAAQVQTNVTFVREHVKAGNVQLRLFNAPHLGRVILTDRCAYFTPYRRDAHGRESRVYKYRRGEMYNNLRRLFEQLWEAQ
jgi:hypothetical protein